MKISLRDNVFVEFTSWCISTRLKIHRKIPFAWDTFTMERECLTTMTMHFHSRRVWDITNQQSFISESVHKQLASMSWFSQRVEESLVLLIVVMQVFSVSSFLRALVLTHCDFSAPFCRQCLKEIVHFHEIIFFAMDLWFFMFKMISKENKTYL